MDTRVRAGSVVHVVSEGLVMEVHTPHTALTYTELSVPHTTHVHRAECSTHLTPHTYTELSVPHTSHHTR